MFQFVGQWTLMRSITHFKHSPFSIINVTGVACFSPFEGELCDLYQLDYVEDVMVSLPHTTLSAKQAYLYVIEPLSIKVFFVTEGGLFHELNTHDMSMGSLPITLLATTHSCRSDVYQTKYVFHDADHFSIEYTVKGPKKDYVTLTYFSRR